MKFIMISFMPRYVRPIPIHPDLLAVPTLAIWLPEHQTKAKLNHHIIFLAFYVALALAHNIILSLPKRIINKLSQLSMV